MSCYRVSFESTLKFSDSNWVLVINVLVPTDQVLTINGILAINGREAIKGIEGVGALSAVQVMEHFWGSVLMH